MPMLICEADGCSVPFQRVGRQKYCSRLCRQTAYRDAVAERQRAWRAAHPERYAQHKRQTCDNRRKNYALFPDIHERHKRADRLRKRRNRQTPKTE